MAATWFGVFHFFLRVFEALLGIFCLATATMLYQSEHDKIQTAFEAFWIRLDDYKKPALSRHAAFMTQVARLESRLLDTIFGEKLISIHAFAVSACFAAGSLGLADALMDAYPIQEPNVLMLFTFSDGKELSMFALFLASVISLAAIVFLKKRRVAFRALVASAFTMFVLLYLRDLVRSTRPENMLWDIRFDSRVLVGAMLGSFVCDVAFVTFTRAMLRFAAQMNSAAKVTAVVVLDLLLGFLLLVPFFFSLNLIGSDNALPWIWNSQTLGTIGLSNIFDVALAALFVLLAVLLLFHRALWPLLVRSVLKLTDMKVRRAVLTAIGLALLSTSLFGGKFPELVKKLIEIFAG